MSEHMPEPWTFEWLEADHWEGWQDHAVTEFTIGQTGGDRNDIATIYFDEGATVTTTREQAAEIARLFAAAPETKRLLAELVAAAEPISAVAERIPDGINDYTVFLRFPLHDRGLDTEVTAGMLRRLAAAVAATKAKGE